MPTSINCLFWFGRFIPKILRLIVARPIVETLEIGFTKIRKPNISDRILGQVVDEVEQCVSVVG